MAAQVGASDCLPPLHRPLAGAHAAVSLTPLEKTGCVAILPPPPAIESSRDSKRHSAFSRALAAAYYPEPCISQPSQASLVRHIASLHLSSLTAEASDATSRRLVHRPPPRHRHILSFPLLLIHWHQNKSFALQR